MLINYTYLVLFKIIIIIGLINFTSAKIVDLTDSNFEEYRLKHDYVLIYFHASYSEESKNLQGHFRKLPNYLQTDKDLIYAVITQKNYQITHKYNIEFPLPKIILVNKESHFEYKGEIKTNEIGDWVERKINRKLAMINSSEELLEILEKFDRLILLTGEQNKIKEFTKTSNLTDIFTDLQFFYVNNPTIIQNLNIENKFKNLNEKVIILKTYDDLINVYKGKITNHNLLEKFIRGFAYPLINQFSSNNYLYAVNNKISFSVLILPSNYTEEESQILIDEFYKNSKKFPGELFFMYGNLTDQSQTTLALDFEVEEKNLPVFLIQQYPKSEKILKRFKFTEFDSEDLTNISEFFDKYKYGALRRFLKSEKQNLEPYNLKENVYYLQRNNFFDILINDENKFSIIFFSRKNCGSCNEYKKEFLQVAHYHRDKLIQFAIVDGIANEFDEFEIPGFPSLLLFKTGKDKIKHYWIYDSLFTYDNIFRFVKQHM